MIFLRSRENFDKRQQKSAQSKIIKFSFSPKTKNCLFALILLLIKVKKMRKIILRVRNKHKYINIEIKKEKKI